MEKKPFDYNSLIGMILLGAIMLWYLNSSKPEVEPEKTSTEQVIDSTKNNVVENTIIEDTAIVGNDSLQNVALTNKFGAFAYSAINAEKGTSTI